MKCPKCLHEDICTNWHLEKYDCRHSSRDEFKFNNEHLHHHCKNCHYEWFTKTADSQESVQEGGK